MVHPFYRPIHAADGPRDPVNAAALGKAVHCECPNSPWCDGPTGPYWLSCSASCRSCHPRPRRRRVGQDPDGP